MAEFKTTKVTKANGDVVEATSPAQLNQLLWDGATLDGSAAKSSTKSTAKRSTSSRGKAKASARPAAASGGTAASESTAGTNPA